MSNKNNRKSSEQVHDSNNENTENNSLSIANRIGSILIILCLPLLLWPHQIEDFIRKNYPADTKPPQPSQSDASKDQPLAFNPEPNPEQKPVPLINRDSAKEKVEIVVIKSAFRNLSSDNRSVKTLVSLVFEDASSKNPVVNTLVLSVLKDAKAENHKQGDLFSDFDCRKIAESSVYIEAAAIKSAFHNLNPDTSSESVELVSLVTKNASAENHKRGNLFSDSDIHKIAELAVDLVIQSR